MKIKDLILYGLCIMSMATATVSVVRSHVIQGEQGIQGEVGLKGDKGDKGEDGLNGLDGKDGKDGRDGIDGINGQDGKDGRDGVDGKDGTDGAKGDKGDNGYTPYIGANGNWWINGQDTGVSATVQQKYEISVRYDMKNYSDGLVKADANTKFSIVRSNTSTSSNNGYGMNFKNNDYMYIYSNNPIVKIDFELYVSYNVSVNVSEIVSNTAHTIYSGTPYYNSAGNTTHLDLLTSDNISELYFGVSSSSTSSHYITLTSITLTYLQTR